MNWDMIGALAELTGAIAVVLSLLYLAQQIRFSAQASRRSTVRELMNAGDNLLQQLAQDGSQADHPQ